MASILLNSNYRIIRALRGSNYAFLAQDIEEPDSGYCVLKQLPLPSDIQSNRLFRGLFLERVEILQRLASVNVPFAQLSDYFEEDGQLYMVREWIEGTTLTCRVQKGGVLDEAEAGELLYSLLQDLSQIHAAQTFHGNLKPSNIVLRGGEPLLTDFIMLPVAPELPSAIASTSPDEAIAPLGFSPPEYATGQIFYASDLYSLGLIAIYVLTGKAPHDLYADPQTGRILWQRYATDLTPELVEVIDRAIQPHPEDRYATAAEMLVAFEEAVAAPPTHPVAVSLPHLPVNAALINRGIQLVAGLAFVAGVFLLGRSLFGLVFKPSVADSGANSAANPAAPALNTASPSATASGTAAPASPSPGATLSPIAQSGPLTQDDAVAVINQWLGAKRQIFSPPFNAALVASLTTNPLYQDVAAPGGAMEWLKANNARYEFRSSQVASVENLTAEGDRAVVDVTVSEDRTLYVGQTIDATQSGQGISRMRYELQAVDGVWKIADYRSAPPPQAQTP
ncbi:MAG TPA: IMS domain-containing protein [Chroococcidiopsis sp.]